MLIVSDFAPCTVTALRRLALIAAALLSIVAAPALAADEGAEAALRTSQAALGRVVGDHAFRDGRGRTVRLSDFRGRPLVISMVYTSCADICPQITETLARAAEQAWRALGRDAFGVITVGFDAAVDNPQAMLYFARRHAASSPNWQFLSGDLTSIAALSDDIGFTFFRSPKGFDHLSQTTIIDARGRVAAQIYGDDFPLPQLVEPLKQLVFGDGVSLIERVVDQVRLFCTVYDAASGKYRFDYSIFVEIFAGLVVLTPVALFLLRNWRRRG